MELLQGNGATGLLDLLLGGLGVVLLGALEDDSGNTLDEVLGLLEAKTGELTDDLDDGDLLVAESGELEGRLMSTESLFVTYPSLRVSDAQAKRFKNGGALDASRTSLRGVQTENGSVYRIRDREESFLGLARVDEGSLKIFKLF